MVEDFQGSLNHSFFEPDRVEVFCAIVALNPAAGEDSAEDLSRHLAGLDGPIRNVVNRIAPSSPDVHRYARLLDLERAAAYMASWNAVHGGNCECYADVEAIGAQLGWLALAVDQMRSVQEELPHGADTR